MHGVLVKSRFLAFIFFILEFVFSITHFSLETSDYGTGFHAQRIKTGLLNRCAMRSASERQVGGQLLYSLSCIGIDALLAFLKGCCREEKELGG